MEIIGSVTFFQENAQVRSNFDFDLKYFNGNKALADKVMEGLHYDFLHRMQEEGLVTYSIPKNG